MISTLAVMRALQGCCDKNRLRFVHVFITIRMLTNPFKPNCCSGVVSICDVRTHVSQQLLLD